LRISSTHNASKGIEKDKLKEKFKDSDIVVDTGYACYVKGRLQPTRSLGDFYLKFKEFNVPNDNLPQKYISRIINDFNGPYIEHLPEIQIHKLKEEDEFLVLATDGLWDWLDSNEVGDIISTYNNDKNRIARTLLDQALLKVAETYDLKLEEVLNLPLNLKRSFHDDISILVVDLRNQV
jgi:pyruvate dehydrogenase phosphatase